VGGLRFDDERKKSENPAMKSSQETGKNQETKLERISKQI